MRHRRKALDLMHWRSFAQALLKQVEETFGKMSLWLSCLSLEKYFSSLGEEQLILVHIPSHEMAISKPYSSRSVKLQAQDS